MVLISDLKSNSIFEVKLGVSEFGAYSLGLKCLLGFFFSWLRWNVLFYHFLLILAWSLFCQRFGYCPLLVSWYHFPQNTYPHISFYSMAVSVFEGKVHFLLTIKKSLSFLNPFNKLWLWIGKLRLLFFKIIIGDCVDWLL